MKLNIKKATTDVSVYLFIQDSSVSTGAGKTGLAYNTASLVCYYVRPLAAAAQLALATQTVTGAHSDGGFVEVDATNMPGVYRLDLSDAVCATGVNSVVVMLKGAANMAPVVLEIQLVSYDPNDAVRAGLTALPNAAADAAGGLVISDAGGLDIDDMKADINTIDDFLDTEVAAILAAVDTEVAAIKAKTDNLPAAPAATGDIPTANANADALLDRANGIETSFTLRQALRLVLAASAGKLSGAATTTVAIRDVGDSKDRISATVDADGNRSAVTLDAT